MLRRKSESARVRNGASVLLSFKMQRATAGSKRSLHPVTPSRLSLSLTPTHTHTVSFGFFFFTHSLLLCAWRGGNQRKLVAMTGSSQKIAKNKIQFDSFDKTHSRKKANKREVKDGSFFSKGQSSVRLEPSLGEPGLQPAGGSKSRHSRKN